MPGPTGTLEEILQPLKADPERSAVLLDVDGVLAPIVQHPDDAHMPETTRRPLIEVAKRYGVVACVSGRRASDARRIVALGSIAYLGSHGSEVLRPGAVAPELDRELQAWTRRVHAWSSRSASGATAPGRSTSEPWLPRYAIEPSETIRRASDARRPETQATTP